MCLTFLRNYRDNQASPIPEPLPNRPLPDHPAFALGAVILAPSIVSFPTPSPVGERWHLPSAITVSAPVQPNQSVAVQVGQSSYLHAVPAPCPLSLCPAEVLSRTLRPPPKSETSIFLLAAWCQCFAAEKRDPLPTTGTPRKW